MKEKLIKASAYFLFTINLLFLLFYLSFCYGLYITLKGGPKGWPSHAWFDQNIYIALLYSSAIMGLSIFPPCAGLKMLPKNKIYAFLLLICPIILNIYKVFIYKY